MGDQGGLAYPVYNLLLIGIAIGGFIVYRRVMALMNDLEVIALDFKIYLGWMIEIEPNDKSEMDDLMAALGLGDDA